MKSCLYVLGITAIIAVCTPAYGITFVDDFENGANVGGWEFGTGLGYIEETGGNPGAYYRDSSLCSFAPHPMPLAPCPLQGNSNYRMLGLNGVGIDLVLHSVSGSADDRPLSVVLINDNNTPDEYTDDWGAFLMSDKNIPTTLDVWESYDFTIPIESAQWPADWGAWGAGDDSDASWNSLITDVDQFYFYYGDPTDFFLLQNWDTGMDNVRVSFNNIPEPASLSLLGLGIALVVRRKS